MGKICKHFFHEQRARDHRHATKCCACADCRVEEEATAKKQIIDREVKSGSYEKREL